MSRRLYVGWMVAKTIQILEKEKGVTYPKIMKYLISESSLDVTPRTTAEVKKALRNFLKRGFIVRNKLRYKLRKCKKILHFLHSINIHPEEGEDE